MVRSSVAKREATPSIHSGAAGVSARFQRAVVPLGCATVVALMTAVAFAAAARAETPPLVTTGVASEIGLTAATLSGSVSSSAAMQGCWFEWGIRPHFEASAPCQLGDSDGGSFVSATARATELQLGTAYGWRLAATNSAGVAHGATASLTTSGLPEEETPSESIEPVFPTGLPAPAGAGHAGTAAHARVEDGLYIAYCPTAGEPDSELSPLPRANEAMANHTGWPSLECLKMDKGTYGGIHELVGLAFVHNYLLGGYGNDTVWAGEKGDVIWGDYHPAGQRSSQYSALHGGPGPDWIYSSHGFNEIWTGGGDDHLALVYGWGVIHCNGPGLKTLVMRYLKRNRHWRLIGCHRVAVVPYRA